MIFIRGQYNRTKGLLKYYCSRLLIQGYLNMSLRITEQGEKSVQPNELTYRVVMIEQIEQHKGRVNWKVGTGNYVAVGQNLCDIISDDGTITSVKAPLSGLIANRFVDEDVYISEQSLVCLMKVGKPPAPVLDRESYVYKKKIYTRTAGEFESGDLETQRELEKIFGDQKRFRAKDFIQPRDEDDDDEEGLEQRSEEEFKRKPKPSDRLPEDVVAQRKKDEYERYTPEDIKNELKMSERVQQDIQSSNEYYKQIIDENYANTKKQHLDVVYGSPNNERFLQTSVEIDLTNALQFALNEGEKTNIKFELKYLILLGCLHAFTELPYLINSKDKSINITMGFIAGGKLAFPMITNLEKSTGFSTLKERLSIIRATLIDGKEIEDGNKNRQETESLAITNEWDYGSLSGPSVLYVSNYASLSLNSISLKPYVLKDYKVHFLPVMSTTMMFNNEKIEGQDALIFLNKLKDSLEQIQMSTE